MTDAYMHIVFMETAIQTPMEIILNWPVLALQFKESLRSHLFVTVDEIAVNRARFSGFDYGTRASNNSRAIQIRPRMAFVYPIDIAK